MATSKKPRRKLTVKSLSKYEKEILKKAFKQMRKNGVKFIKDGSLLSISVELNGRQRVSYSPGFKELTDQALIQRANPSIRYKK